MAWSNSKGAEAEDFVAARLESSSWTVLSRNYRRRGFELDIIACRDHRLLCIEVKARRSGQSDHQQILSARKIQRLARGMSNWLQTSAPDEDRNVEFWLCIVGIGKGTKVEWSRLEVEAQND